ncbi:MULTISPECIES: hypothetical protein [unclassified Yoonia]|uniref:hypothetical protein n=1 Tax=unclassified Yoonia TaxID=2629118 RepID=UPI002AFF1630|nr:MULTISPECIES: hypothetical protein [unclassified Yoonia]
MGHQGSTTVFYALELAKSAQIAGSFPRQVQELAGALAPKVMVIFQGAYGAIYLLTQPARRHVWNAYLATIPTKRLLSDQGDAIRQNLLHFASHTLITDAYGSCPKGYLALLKRLPHRAASRQFYSDLHQLLADRPDLAMPLCNVKRINHDLVRLLLDLPHDLRCVKVAQAFGSPSGYDNFMVAYARLTSRDTPSADVIRQLKGGAKPGRLIVGLYETAPLPAPFLRNNERSQHLGTARELLKAARDFKNCLANWITEAHHNQSQYYRARLADGTFAVLEIKNDAPAGWRFGDLKGKDNADVAPELTTEMRGYLNGFGVHHGSSIHNLIRRAERSCAGVDDSDLSIFELDDF